MTDCWYSIRTKPDAFLHRMIHIGKITVGMKLGICNAEFEGFDEGASPLEDHNIVMKMYRERLSFAHLVGLPIAQGEFHGKRDWDSKKLHFFAYQ